MGLSLGTLLPLRLRLWVGIRVFGRCFEGPVTRVSWHRVIKGPCRPPEIEAMQYVSEHTDIPIPKVYAIHTDKNDIYIEMEYIRGQTLEDAWRHLSRDQKDTAMADLKQAMATLHALEPPAQDLVSSALQNPAIDCRIGSGFFGPMSSDEFHTMLRKKMPIEYAEEYFGKEIVQVHTTRYRTQFCHSDFAARNIMVRNGRLAAIIDWAYAGWYPEYWDYTRAHYTFMPGDDHYEWQEYLSVTLPNYKTELAVEELLWRRLPDPGARVTTVQGDVTIESKGSKPSPAWLNERAGRQVQDLWTLALAKLNSLERERERLS
ncbi:serine threonine protein kinase [Ophiostoma piceae UAMH 11346]|uniref:Serine threonine protein kinase n=1 Tax=Ophiostoma piceae (strain UAMH 11346) TaxID=1262450 RepID=S3C633_OPHP1|nr:serine threonine protein kinase [Ophiostoma piceae UAMH 11346]